MSAMTTHFHWLDYSIFAGFLIVSTFVGIFLGWRGRKTTSAKSFLTGSGEMSWVLISFSMQASFFSGIFILSFPGEVYAYGVCCSYLGLSYFIGQPLSAHLFIPVFYKMKILSVYEYLEKRYNKLVRICGSILFSTQTLLYLPLVLYAPALALAQVTGISIFWSILFCGLVCTLYTCLGGMKATVWNDTIQMIIIFTGLITVVCIGLFRVGFGEFLRRNEYGGRLNFNEFRFDPTLRTTFWSQVVGGTLFTALNLSSNQTLVQKMFSCKNVKDTYKAQYLSMINCFCILVLITFLGLISYALYFDCDPLTSGVVTKLDQIVPLMVMEVLKGLPGLPGLFIATAFSAALSSMSGCLNGLAAVFITDFCEPLFQKCSYVIKDKSRVILTRIIVFTFGIYTTIMAYNAHFMGESTMQLSFTITGITGGPLFAAVVLGMSCRFVNAKGITVGLIVGLAVGSWIGIGSLVSNISNPMLPFDNSGCPDFNNTTNFSNYSTWSHFDNISSPAMVDAGTLSSIKKADDWLYRISFFNYVLIGFFISLIFGILVSLLTGGNDHVDPGLLFEFLRKGKKSKVDEEYKKRLDKVRLSQALVDISTFGLFERTLVVKIDGDDVIVEKEIIDSDDEKDKTEELLAKNDQDEKQIQMLNNIET